MRTNMLIRPLVGIMMFLLSLAGTVKWLHAAIITPNIQIENEKNPATIAKQFTQLGGWTVKHSNGTTFSCPSGTTNKYTISGSPTRIGDDTSSPDYVMFHNATITANNANVCGHIYFWAKFLPGPSGTVDFDLFTNGSLKRGNGGATSSWVHISGWVQHPSTSEGESDGTSGTWEHIGSLNGPPTSAPAIDRHPTSTSFGFTNSIDEHPDLTGITSARIMKGEIWFLLTQANDKLILSDGTGIKVQTAAGGGGEDLQLCQIFECPDLEFLKTLEKTRVIERLELIEKKLGLPPLPPLPNEPITDKPSKE